MAAKGFDYRRRRPWLAWGAEREWPPLNPIPADPNTYVYISSDHTTDPPDTGTLGGDRGLFSPATTFQTLGANTATSRGTTITANAAAHTYGSWTSLGALTAAAEGFLFIIGNNSLGAPDSFLVQLSHGGSNTVIAPFYYQGAGESHANMFIPYPVSSGETIYARVACTTGAGTVQCMAVAAQPSSSFSLVRQSFDRYNDGGSLANGVTVTCGAVNTKGSWAQLSSAAASQGVGSWAYIQAFGDPSGFNFALIDIGVGAGGSETVKVADLWLARMDSGGLGWATSHPLPLQIPSGTRISARAQSDSAGMTLDVVLVYDPYPPAIP